MAPPDRLNVFLVSDATGGTVESVLTSVRVQFPYAQIDARRFNFVRTERQIDELIAAAPERKCAVIYTIVSEKLRARLSDACAERGLSAVDVTGPLMRLFSGVLHKEPLDTPGAKDEDEEDLVKLAEAIRYTMKHDDGMSPEGWKDADLVILGLSRTGKTPASIYLSCKRIKVANVPVVPGSRLSDDLIGLPVRKVGFKIQAERLAALRRSRMERISAQGLPGYAEERTVSDEIRQCEQAYRRIPGIKVLDVTNRSIEETAEWITRNVL